MYYAIYADINCLTYPTGHPEMKTSDASELSNIIAKSGSWKQWCKHLEVTMSTCSVLDYSRDRDTDKALEVAEAYLKQVGTCWEKVVEVLCKKLIEPDHRAARDLAQKHSLTYSMICEA